MAYDVHIVRTEDWLDAADNPITKDDVDAVVHSDAELAWSTSDWVDLADDDGNVKRYFAIVWNGEPCFYWIGSELCCFGPDENQLEKMLAIANKLDAHVLGDDGEKYPLQ